MELLQRLFGSAGFEPHGQCLLWDQGVLWFNVVSDAIIALAYYSIPVGLIYFAKKRDDLPFHWMFIMFGAFIFACGTTHVMGIWTVWRPVYWLDGAVKALTAGLSLATAIVLWPLLPKALALPSRGQFEQINRELRTENEERRQAEMRLKQHAEQIESINLELESFSFSVSHDLRAPLRHIDGFADLLKKHAALMLDEKGRRQLETISESAQHMGRLIDDLLTFSRAGRTELQHATVSLDRLVTEALQDLLPDTEHRNIDWKIGPLPDVCGDAFLLRQALVNVLANAVKYTRTRAQARIEIGCDNGTPEEHIFYVRDNGVGFDMQYAHKLFGVFQRLHRSDEFEGTGIGLANVRRIIHRHGGRTWADGAVGGGATVYVSLPRRDPCRDEPAGNGSIRPSASGRDRSGAADDHGNPRVAI